MSTPTRLVERLHSSTPSAELYLFTTCGHREGMRWTFMNANNLQEPFARAS